MEILTVRICLFAVISFGLWMTVLGERINFHQILPVVITLSGLLVNGISKVTWRWFLSPTKYIKWAEIFRALICYLLHFCVIIPAVYVFTNQHRKDDDELALLKERMETLNLRVETGFDAVQTGIDAILSALADLTRCRSKIKFHY